MVSVELNMKIFGVGFIKTGTVSLGRALQCLGYAHCHGSFLVGNRMIEPYLSGNLEPLFQEIEKYDSFEDFPFCAPGMMKILDHKYPDSKFILTTREGESWYQSVTNYLEPNNMVLTSQKANKTRPMGNLYGLINYLLVTFGTLDMTNNKKHYIEKYQEYNQSVIDHFKECPDKLLVVSWMEGDGWEKLCSFLNKSIPKITFPHANKNPNKVI